MELCIEYRWWLYIEWTIVMDERSVDGVMLLIVGQCSLKDEENTGSWEEPGSGYKTLGSGCITHSNRSNKGRKAFVFRCNYVADLETVNWAIDNADVDSYY